MKIWFVFTCLLPIAMNAQDIINLYPGAIPNEKQTGITETNTTPFPGMIRRSIIPTLEIYLPEKEKATGAAVVICPGGGYSVIVYQGEGLSTAKEFVKKGIAAFVLKYRLPNDSFVINKSIAPLQDAQQAIKIVRENAAKWNVDINKVGIVGFSAGGHLASTEATHFKKALIENDNNTNLRPDFQVLIYPVITMQSKLTHADSRTKLLGKDPSQAIVDEFSNELQVDSTSPPAYITHAADDNVVDVDNSIEYFEKLRRNKVPVEMHIYPKGGHGFIFRQPGWADPLFLWMKNLKLIGN
ncbi:MAG: alpha/beta hydrolase [Chitinophagaceae bacterium]